MTTILKGCIVSAPALGRLETTEHGYLIAENGHITGVYPVLPEQYAGAPVEDYGDDPLSSPLPTCISTHLSIPCWAPAWTCRCWTG